MIKIYTDLQESFGVLQKLKSFEREEMHIYFLYRLNLVDDVIDFFNKVMVLSDRYNTTLLLHEEDLKEEPVRQLQIKYKDEINIEEITDEFYKGIFERKGRSICECAEE